MALTRVGNKGLGNSVSFDEFSIATVTLIEDVETLLNLIPTTVSKEFD